MSQEATESAIAGALASSNYNAAATHIIEAYGPEIMGLLVRSVNDDLKACDVFSAWSEDIWKSMATFRQACSARTWAYKLAHSALSRYRRDPYERRGQRLHSEAASRIVEESRQSTARFLRTEVKDRFRDLRRQLSEDEQWLLTLRVDREMGWGDIAIVLADEELDPGELKAHVNRVTVRFHRLKAKLKRLAHTSGLLDREDA